MSEKESLKQRLRKGDIIVGMIVPITVNRSQLDNILSRDTYDFIAVDSQHSAFNEERLESLCAMAQDIGIPVQFRIKHTRQAFLIGNLLDLGPLIIEVPFVEELSTADESVAAFYYPPVGKRSWGGNSLYGLKGNNDRLEYTRWWNSHGILCLQIETVGAVTNARQLAKPGVDCFTWGPGDLAFDLEAHPMYPFRNVDDCVRHVLKQLEGTDIRVSFRSGSRSLRNKYIDMGVTVLMERPEP